MNPRKINSHLIGEAINEQRRASILNVDLSNPEEIRRLKWDLLKKANEVCPGFQLPDEMKPVLNDLFNWCVMLPARLDPHKGLWLWGNIGTGKSTMLEIVRQFCYDVRPKDIDGNYYSFRITSVNDVCRDFMDSNYKGVQTYITSNRQAFDDLGTEPSRLNYYGTTVNVMEYVLLGRYERRHESFTHVTTNLSPKQIREVYGERVYDRAKEMFNFVEMAGATFRG